MSSGVTLYSLGHIVRLQIQRTPLKLGEKPHRQYDPAGLLSVAELTLTPQGALARLPDGRLALDAHHAEHPLTRNNGRNALSVGFTPHYAAMRAKYGPHLADGCAGENILIETEGMIELAAVSSGIALQSARAASVIWLREVRVALPCREFSGFAQDGPGAAAIKEALQFLDNGMRGFICALAQTEPVTVVVGDPVFVPQVVPVA